MGDTVDWQNLHPLSAALTQGIPIRALLLVKGPHARHRTPEPVCRHSVCHVVPLPVRVLPTRVTAGKATSLNQRVCSQLLANDLCVTSVTGTTERICLHRSWAVPPLTRH